MFNDCIKEIKDLIEECADVENSYEYLLNVLSHKKYQNKTIKEIFENELKSKNYVSNYLNSKKNEEVEEVTENQSPSSHWVTNQLPAGKYWVGDPCYILTKSEFFNWVEFNRRRNTIEEGIITEQGITFAFYNVGGDDLYTDLEDNDYEVNSGMLSCIPLDSILDKSKMFYGNVHEFDKPFKVVCDNGVISFGHVEINTSFPD